MYTSSDDCPKYLKTSQRPPDETIEVSIPRERDLTPFYSSLVTLSLEESSTFIPFMPRIHLPPSLKDGEGEGILKGTSSLLIPY